MGRVSRDKLERTDAMVRAKKPPQEKGLNRITVNPRLSGRRSLFLPQIEIKALEFLPFFLLVPILHSRNH